jgi:hypothetical protein
MKETTFGQVEINSTFLVEEEGSTQQYVKVDPIFAVHYVNWVMVGRKPFKSSRKVKQ